MKQRLCPQVSFCKLLMSLALSVLLCKYACAEETIDERFAEGFKLGGYSSAGINLHTNGEVDAAINQISMILSWSGNSRLSFFSELELERALVWNEKQDETHKDSHVDLERLYVDMNLSEKVNFRVGRYLTPAGRWNQLHAAPLVWTSTRPLVTSRLFPLSNNGLMMYGAIPFADQAIEYKVFTEVVKDKNRDSDETLFQDLHGARIEWVGGSNIGISLLEFKERVANQPQFRMLGLDFLTHYRDWEISGEAFQRFDASGDDGGSGAYIQTAIPFGHQWYGLARLENFQRPEEGSSESWLVGAAWRITPKQMLKVEFIGGDEERSESPKGLLASFAILF